MFVFFIWNDVILQNQSSFKPVDLCINQHLSNTQEISRLFDDGFDLPSIFLHISKVLNKVQDGCIIFKFK